MTRNKSSSKINASEEEADLMTASSLVTLTTSGGARAVPDGGWGWIVVLSTFFLHVSLYGVSHSFGLLVEPMSEQLESTRAELGWLGSMVNSVTWMLGPFSSKLISKYGCRSVAMAGSTIASAGCFCSSFMPDIFLLYFTFGLTVGTGFSMIYVSAVSSVTLYFEKKLTFATGLSVSGCGMGIFLFGPLTQILVENYGWRGTLLIDSGLVLNGILCATFLERQWLTKKTPAEIETTSIEIPSNHRQTTKIQYQQVLPTTFTHTSAINHVRSCNYHSEDYASKPVEDTAYYTEAMTSSSSSSANAEEGCTVLLSPVAIIYGISTALNSFAYAIPTVFIPDRAQLQFGLSSDCVGWLISVIGIANIFSRIGIGYLADSPRLRRIVLFYCISTLCSVLTFFSEFYSSFTTLSLYCGIIGMYMGVYSCLEPAILCDLLGREKFTSILGLSLCFSGVGGFISAPIAGWLYDTTLSYNNSFYVMGATLAAGSFLLVCLDFYQCHVNEDGSADRK